MNELSPVLQLAFAVARDIAAAPQPTSPASGRAVLDLIPAAVYVLDRDGLIINYNKNAAELWGQAPALRDPAVRFCGSYRLYLPNGQFLPIEQAPIVAALRGEAVRDAEVVFERPDGTRSLCLVNIEPIRGADGEILGVVNCFHDISSQREAEARLAHSEAFLRAVVETTPECIKIVTPEGSLLEMNAAGLEMIESDGRAAIGANVFDLIAPEDRDEWRSRHERVCRGEKQIWEFELVSLRGSRRRMATHAAPLVLPDGRTGHLAVTRDVTERRRQELALEASERALRELLQALPMPVYTTDAAGAISFYNDAAAEFWGHRPELGASYWCGSWRLYRSDGSPLPHHECPMARAIKERRPIRNEQAVAERPDGIRVPFMPYPTPLYDASGELVGAVNMLVDITVHKQAQGRQELLIQELNHRVKNTLATVQAIAAHTLRRAASAEEFSKTFSARLMALSAAHDLLTQSNWQGAALDEVVRSQLAALVPADARRIELTGDSVQLQPRESLALAMVFHELATNAAKYGALANHEGVLRVTWEIVAGDRLRLRWIERPGHPVEKPSQTGFGTRLIEATVRGELGGEYESRYGPFGFECEFAVPLGTGLRDARSERLPAAGGGPTLG